MLSEEHRIDMAAFSKQIPQNAVLVDLRDAISFKMGTVSGARNIPIDGLGELYQLPKDQKIYVFCQSGEASGAIVELLLDAGYQAYELSGGFRAYLRTKFVQEQNKEKETERNRERRQ